MSSAYSDMNLLMMARLSADLLPVNTGHSASHRNSASVPMITHNGTLYAIADPGVEWELRVNVLNPTQGQSYQVFVKLDGKDIGYSKVTCCNFPYSLPCSISFEGFVHTDPSTGNIYYKAFKFGALKPAAGADIIQHLDEIQAGRIEIRGEEVVQLPGERVPQPFSTRWATDAANKRLPEGKKWFLQPGLQTEQGSTVKQTTQSWDRRVYQKVRDIEPLKLRYDTADNLRLRKILDPSKPQHAEILTRAGVTSGSGSHAGSSRQPKQERRAAGVKRERGADQQQAAAAASEGPAVPRSATAETINLADDAPAPLRVGGRVLAADELAVCDLAGIDDEEGAGPVWKVQKKQAIEVAL